MGSSVSYHVKSEELAFSVIDNTGQALLEVVEEQSCTGEMCQRIAESKAEQMCQKFSPGQLAWTCQKLGIAANVDSVQDMSRTIVQYYASQVEIKEAKCQQCQVNVNVETPPPVVYSPTPIPTPTLSTPPAAPKPITQVHKVQGTPEPKSVKVTADEIRRNGSSLLVRNPKSVSVTQNIPKSKLAEFSNNLGENSKITSIVAAEKRQNIPRGTPVIALDDHIPKSKSEIPLSKGQKTNYLEPASRGWALVKHDNGISGYVPGSHLSL